MNHSVFVVETVLSITGAVVGTFLCFVFPSALYILSVSKENGTRTTAKVISELICIIQLFLNGVRGGSRSKSDRGSSCVAP